MITRCISLSVTSLSAAVLLTGCLHLKPQPDPVRFYVLSGTSGKAEVESFPDGRVLFVGRVDAPDYLGQPGIAVRRTESRIDFSSIHHWAEPVRDGATRVLQDELGRRLGPGRIHTATIRRPVGPYLELQIVLLQFECTAAQEAVLRARWRILREPERQPVAGDEIVCRRGYALMVDDHTPAVRALAGCLEDLAAVIATRLGEAEGG